MENSQPRAILRFPDGPAVVSGGGILAIIRALNLYGVSSHYDVRFIREGVEIADRKRFHVPLFHVVQFLLQIGDSVRVNSAEVLIDEFFEVVWLLVFKRLPGAFFFL